MDFFGQLLVSEPVRDKNYRKLRAWFLACLSVQVSTTAACGAPLNDRIKKEFKSDQYTVTVGTTPKYAADAALEIGDGNGHGCSLQWMRFHPEKDNVEVLSIQLNEEWKQYTSKWPPDKAPVAVKIAQMKPEAYASLLQDLAIVNAAKLNPVERNTFGGMSSNDFWVYAQLDENNKKLIQLNWAGYGGSRGEMEYAKPAAAVNLAHNRVEHLDFKEHKLTDAERAWASAKFSRDWKDIKDKKFFWWVRERYIIVIGVAGDTDALPTLKNILAGDVKDRCVYYAINAITRLTREDKRDKPVEDMDIEKTRQKVFTILKDTSD